MDRERLTVESLPVRVLGLVDAGEETSGLQLTDDPQGSAGALDQAIRGSEPDIALSADDCLIGDVLVGQFVDLDLHTSFAHPLEGDEQGERLDGLDIAQRDADGSLIALSPSRTLLLGTTGQEKPKSCQD